MKGLIVVTSLGNIGAARPTCSNGFEDREGTINIYLKCANGQLDKLSDFGQLSKDEEAKCPKFEEMQGDLNEKDKKIRAKKLSKRLKFVPRDCNIRKWTKKQKK